MDQDGRDAPRLDLCRQGDLLQVGDQHRGAVAHLEGPETVFVVVVVDDDDQDPAGKRRQ
ncbi:hypothetical protein ACLM5J_12800 [Nocardioides sp. Bht2]|uniref:hypothetical protein n=1 Tax=Nocardioides sp. Bht2 TaxID=3392297 RepID=UPI0039B39BAF